MKERKRKTIALLSTIAFHALLIMVLLLMGLSYPDPPPREIGVEMDFGSLTDVGNALPGEPGGSAADNVAMIQQTNNENYITQNTEQSPISARPKTTSTQSTQPVTNPEPVQSIDPNALFKKQNINNNGGGGQGEGQGGGSGAGNNGGGGSGSDMTGSGTSFSLAGRNAKSLTRPATSTSEVGKIVVEIIVDKDGNVLRATAGMKGTTISNATIFRQCEVAAKSSKFSPKQNAAEEQRGTITYQFVK